MKEVNATIGCDPENPDSVLHRSIEADQHLTGNADYPVLNPDLPTVEGATTDVVNTSKAWGNGMGKPADLVHLKNATKILYGLLTQLCANVNSLTPHDSDKLVNTGFPLSHDPHGLPVLGPVQNVHRYISPNITQEKVKINSKKPANASPNQKITYKLFRGIAPEFNAATCIAEGTKTTFTDVPAVTVPTVFYYWMTALTPAGESGASDVLKVTVSPA